MGRARGVLRVFGISKLPFHLVLLLAGACFLMTNAFHGNVWFDESYSVGIASKPFSEIWSIGANDVHPVLFYWCLHVLYLVFGSNVLVYRLFAVAGTVALAALGATHLRRDFGWRVGVHAVSGDRGDADPHVLVGGVRGDAVLRVRLPHLLRRA